MMTEADDVKGIPRLVTVQNKTKSIVIASSQLAKYSEMKFVLAKLGLLHLDEAVITPSRLELLKNYIHAPTATGVLEALYSAAGCDATNLTQLFQTKAVNASFRRSLFAFLSDPIWSDTYTDSMINILKCLPVFEVHQGSKAHFNTFISTLSLQHFYFNAFPSTL